jgi:antitoxin component YwqK of YwqJK toxin-antitoxin module
MALTNGMKFFSVALALIFLSSCNREETNAKIYFKVKNPKDYTDNEYNFEPLTPTKFDLLVVSPLDLSNFTFYDRNHNLIRRAKIEDEDYYDRYFRAPIKNGKVHGFLRVYEKVEKPSFFVGGVYKSLKDNVASINDENLQLKAEYSFYFGITHGRYREFEDGHLVKIGRYYFGNKIGVEKEFYSTGRLRSIVNYKYGEKVGAEKIYHPDGQLKAIHEYGPNEVVLTSKLFNSSGLLVEENRRSNQDEIHRVYDFNSKTYKTFNTDTNDVFTGLYFSRFDEDGALMHAVDLSKLDSKKIIFIYPDLKIELVFNADKKASILIKPENSASTYVVNDELNVFKHYVGNQLKGIYNMKTGEVNGVINFIKINKFFEERTSFDRYGIFDDIDDWMKVSSTPQLYLFQVDKESRDLRDFCEFIID